MRPARPEAPWPSRGKWRRYVEVRRVPPALPVPAGGVAGAEVSIASHVASAHDGRGAGRLVPSRPRAVLPGRGEGGGDGSRRGQQVAPGKEFEEGVNVGLG